jgi:glycosyltransferase involved in cell wall biosynthesis
MINKPTVSVIIPTYNRALLIGKAIKSVLNQTYHDFEIIVIDDGSTDNTEETVKSFNNFKIRYIFHSDNRGVSAARNTGIRASRGKYIALLDSDDEWLPEKLDEQIKVFKSEFAEVGVVYSNVLYIDESGKNMNKLSNPKKVEGYIYEDLLGGNYVGTSSTLLIKKECFDRVGLFDDLLKAENDWDMWIRIAKYYRFALIKIPLVKYRFHSNRISNNPELKIIMASRILVKYANELKKRRGTHSKLYFRISNRFYHLGKMKEGQRYLLKAISLYPFCIRYYICMFGSLFGPKCFICFVNIKRYLINIKTNLFIKFRNDNLL